MSEPEAWAPPFDSLDFLYMPSRDVAADLAFYRDDLGAEVVFAIEAFAARVAQVRLSQDEPRLLLADHLEGEAAVLVYRVADLDAALAELERRGLTIDARFGIPHGPCAAVHTPLLSWPLTMETSLEPLLATARSVTPSPLKSPEVIAEGSKPTGML